MEKDMTTGSPIKLILFFSIPILIGNLVQQLYNLFDAMIVGRFVNVEAFAAVGATGAMSFLLLGFVFGLTSGFAVILAQRYGAKDEEGFRKVLAMTVYLCVLGTVVITFIGMLTAKPLLHIMNTPPEIMGYAYSYISIIYAGIVVTFLYNMMAALLRAIGDSISPLIFLGVAAGINIGLDLLFIVVFHMGVAGAAYATVISQAISGILCVVYAFKKYSFLKLEKRHWQWDGVLAIKLLNQGVPMAFQFSIIAIGVVILQGALNLLGTDKIAAYTAASKVEQFVTQPANTFGVTMANYTGQNLGAGKMERIREGVRKATVLTVIFAFLATAIVFFLGEPLIELFIDKDKAGVGVIGDAMHYLKIIGLFFPALNVLFIYRNTLQGLGKGTIPFLTGIFELITRSVAAFALPQFIGFTGIALAGPMAWFSAAIPLGIGYFYISRKKDTFSL